MKEMNRRLRMIVYLLVAIILSGAVFYFLWDDDSTVIIDNQIRVSGSGDVEPVLKDMPSPDTYMKFSYERGKGVPVTGNCADKYRVVLVYPKEIDYRYDPLSAKYNTASACEPGSTFMESLLLDGFNLKEGAEYYVVRAHQGDTGMWHDPY